MALWGNPIKWEYTTYNFYNISENAVTSSSVIYDHICPGAESFIFLPDSLFPALYADKDKINSHKGQIMEIVTQNMKEKEDIKSVEFMDKSNIDLFPSSGSFTSNGIPFTFKVDIDYLYTYFYTKSLCYMERQQELEKVVIDMTHGINFLQFIFLESIKYSCMVYSLRHRKNIVIEYYNSSPYSRGVPISIIMVRRLNISFKNVLSPLSRDFLNIYKSGKESIINYYNNQGIDINPQYIRGSAIMVLSVTLPYLAYTLGQIDEIKIPAYDEITMSIARNNNITEITHEFPDYYKTYMENLAFFHALIAIKEFTGYKDGISVAKIYNALDLYFGRESDRIFVKTELGKITSGYKTDQEFSEDKFSRNFKAHAGLLNNMYELKDKQIKFKTINHNGNKINTDWVIRKLIGE